MFTAILAALSAPTADACSTFYLPPDLVSPGEGALPPGFAVRFSAGDYAPTLEISDDEERYELAADEEGVFLTPPDLQPGDYELRVGAELIPISIEEDAGLEEPDGSVSAAVYRRVGLDSEGTTPGCLPVGWRQHLFATVAVDLPASDENGWAVAVEDDELGLLTWMALGPEPTTQEITVDLGRKREAPVSCVTVRLMDPQNNEVSREDLECTEAVGCGCSSPGGRAGGGAIVAVGLLALFGRRRAR